MNNSIIETPVGNWLLASSTRSWDSLLLSSITCFTELCPVQVLDGGSQFDAYALIRESRRRKALLERISFTRAFTCHQVLAALELMPTKPSFFIAVNLLHTFYDESIPFAERRNLLEHCIPHFARLSGKEGGVVSVIPPKVASPEANQLFKLLMDAASNTYFHKVTLAPKPQPRLL